MGAVRGLRVLVPLLLNPYAPVTIERVDIKVDLKFEANYGEIKEVKVPTGDLVAGQRNMVQVLMSTWDGKDIIEDVPVDVPDDRSPAASSSSRSPPVTARSSTRRRRSICRR